MDKYFKKSIQNIIAFGDTDIFPFPLERYLFEENTTKCVKVLKEYHKDIDESLSNFPPQTMVKLSQVGYFGFRRATLIEPFWNAYYLGLVLSIADKIEKYRIPLEEQKVFSYRYGWNEDKKSLFQEVNWLDYKKRCVELSKEYKYVIQTDISNFYPRVNHHKLENELKRIDKSDVPFRIMKMLSQFSGTISYGLPVGGPASRILAELALTQSDKHLRSRRIEFCRYADDYTIFCNSESDGYKSLVLLSEKLANDQLSLQKSKTKIMTSDEFQEIHDFLDPKAMEENADEEQKLLNISIKFDPYSATAVEDYEALKDSIRQIDIIGILSKEVNKSKIDQTVTKQAIAAISVLEPEDQEKAIKILLDIENLLTLAPVFTSIMRAVRRVMDNLDESVQERVDFALLELFEKDSHLISIELNLNYIIQVLSVKHSQVKEELLIELFESTTNHLLKRQIIITMANWECHYWLIDIKSQFSIMTVWERRAFIYGSYFLGDEGHHWRGSNKKQFKPEELIMRDWSASRFQSNKKILV